MEMGKLIITFLIILFGVCFFFIKKNEKLEIRLNSSEVSKDSLNLEIKDKDSIIKSLNDSLSSKVENVNTTTTKTEKKPNRVAVATWYQSHGDRTYSGETFHKDSLTAAYYTKMGTYLKVTNKKNGKYVIVRVTDRMGSKSKSRIDLSKKAFEQISSVGSGRVSVIIQHL